MAEDYRLFCHDHQDYRGVDNLAGIACVGDVT